MAEAHNFFTSVLSVIQTHGINEPLTMYVYSASFSYWLGSDLSHSVTLFTATSDE